MCERGGHEPLPSAAGPGHRPCDRSLCVTVSANGEALVVHSFAGDDWRDCQDYVYERLGLSRDAWRTRLEPRRRPPLQAAAHAPGDDEKARRRRALTTWGEARSPQGTIVETYLRSRGLELPPESAGKLIRFHDDCPWRADDGEVLHVPAMIALMRDVVTDEPVAIQKTRLTADGAKVSRKTQGPWKDAAIKVDADAEVSMGLVVGEGLETTLTARQKGLRPCWALGSAGGVERLLLLDGVEGLTILAEADAASAKAIEQCGRRWAAAGRDVIIIDPLRGSDLNDALRGAP